MGAPLPENEIEQSSDNVLYDVGIDANRFVVVFLPGRTSKALQRECGCSRGDGNGASDPVERWYDSVACVVAPVGRRSGLRSRKVETLEKVQGGTAAGTAARCRR